MQDLSTLVQQQYDILADDYCKIIDTKAYNAYYERPIMMKIINSIKNLENSNVLEPGCGSGWYTKQLINKNANVTAFDISNKMIEFTKKRVGDKAKIINANLNNPNTFVINNHYNLIVCSLVLHYIYNWNKLFNAFCNTCKKNADIVISIHHPSNSIFKNKEYNTIQQTNDVWNFSNKQFNVSYYNRPLNMVINPIVENGFKIVKILEDLPDERFKNKLPKRYKNLKSNPLFLFLHLKKS